MSGPTRALIYLAVRGALNRLRRAAGAVRQPRYLLAVVAAVLYFGWLIAVLLRAANPAEGSGGGAVPFPDGTEGAAPLALFVLTMVWWVGAPPRSPFALPPAEVHFLLPAPLRRRQLVLYRLARLQPPLVFSALVACAFTWALSGGAVGMGALLRMGAALWMVLMVLQLHQSLAASVRRGSEGRAGREPRAARAVAVVFAGGAVALLASLLPALPALLSATNVEGALRVAGGALSEPLARVVLAPFRWVLAPVFTEGVAAWFAALPPLLPLLCSQVLLVEWVGAPYERVGGLGESLGGPGERAGPALSPGARTRSSGTVRPAPFALAPSGPPATAIIWKNLTLVVRRSRPRAAGAVAAAFVAGYWGTRLATGDPAEAAALCATLALGIALAVLLGGPLALRGDLRADLATVDRLRTWPLAGRTLVSAELAVPVLMLSAVELLFLAAGTAFLRAAYPGLLAPWAGTLVVAGALLVLPPLNVLLVGTQNALALLYPAWARVGVERQGGIERTGTDALNLAGMLLALALALLVPAAVGAGLAGLLAGALGTWAIVPAALVAWGVLCAQAALLVTGLGRRLDRSDPVESGLL